MIKSTAGPASGESFGHDHVWRYFELHANHRMSMLNFFTVVAGLTIAGIGVALQAAPRFSAVGIVLGFGLVFLCFIFWKLDQRTAFLVKHAERAQEIFENELPEALRIFSNEDAVTLAENRARNHWTAIWTYGRSLRITFMLIGLVGVAAIIVSGARVSGRLYWEEDGSPTRQEIAADVDKSGAKRQVAGPIVFPAAPKAAEAQAPRKAAP